MSKRRETRAHLDNLVLDPKAVVEVMGRLIGRTTAHQHAASQTASTLRLEAPKAVHDPVVLLDQDGIEPVLISNNGGEPTEVPVVM